MDVQKNNKALLSSDEKRRKLQGNKLHQKKSNQTIDNSAILFKKRFQLHKNKSATPTKLPESNEITERRRKEISARILKYFPRRPVIGIHIVYNATHF